MFTPLQNIAVLILLAYTACSTDTTSKSETTTTEVDSTTTEPISQDFNIDISLSLLNSNKQEITVKSIYSSSKIEVEWVNNTTEVNKIDHFNLQVSEVKSTASNQIIENIDIALTGYTITELKSSTSYEVTLIACQNIECSTSKKTATQTLKTDEEYWQIQGGDSYTDAHKVAENTNTTPYVRKVPVTDFIDGCYIAMTDSNDDTYDNIANFDNLIEGEAHGLVGSCTEADKAKFSNPFCVATTQAITLKSGAVRLYIDAETYEGNKVHARTYHIDSKDGVVGLDFNSDPLKTICTPDDYQQGGDCEITKDIGVEGDTDIHPSYLTNARQGKIGFATLDSMSWDESVGTFRIATASDSCGVSDNGLFYLSYDGTDWNTYTQDNCAKPLIHYAHGPVIQHLGQSRYKLYYEDATPVDDQEIQNTNSKPLRLIYADGSNTGSDTIVEFDDWESGDQAREVNFVWSNGTMLSTKEESGLGDHMLYVPSTLEEQYMYINLGGQDNPDWNKVAAGIGIAKLLNP